MNTKDELEKQRQELNKQSIKRARAMALAVGLLAFVALISIGYAFFMNAAVKRTQLQAEMSAKIALEQRAIAENALKEAQQAREDCEAKMKQLNDQLSSQSPKSKTGK